MKRILSALLCLFVLFGSFAYASETNDETKSAFDKTVFEASDLYSYDKFAKTWTVQAHWVKQYSDATIKFHIVLFDSDIAEHETPELIVEMFDKDNQVYNEITAFRMIIGEKLYRFEKMEHFREIKASVYGGHVLRHMLNELNTSNEVAIQIDYINKYGESRTCTIDPVAVESLSEVKTIGQLLEASNYWGQFNVLVMTLFDAYYCASEE